MVSNWFSHAAHWVSSGCPLGFHLFSWNFLMISEGGASAVVADNVDWWLLYTLAKYCQKRCLRGVRTSPRLSFIVRLTELNCFSAHLARPAQRTASSAKPPMPLVSEGEERVQMTGNGSYAAFVPEPYDGGSLKAQTLVITGTAATQTRHVWRPVCVGCNPLE